MIDMRIERRPGMPVGGFLLLVLAAGLAGSAVYYRGANLAGPALLPVDLAVFAVLPAALGLALLLVREQPFSARLTPEGLEIEAPIRLSLPYEAIDGVVTPKRNRKRSPIEVFHAGGVVCIPSRLNVRSDELFAFLLDQVAANDTRPLPAGLAKYRSAQSALFGPERVLVYRARPRWVLAWQRRPVAFGVAGLVAALIWVALEPIVGRALGPPWILLACLAALGCVLFSGLIFLVAASGSTRATTLKNWRQCGLVVSPIGLAMIQGDMQGELHWADLRNVRFGGGAFSFQLTLWNTPRAGINLVVEGATIPIIDAYEQPLKEIHEQIRAYWKGDRGG